MFCLRYSNSNGTKLSHELVILTKANIQSLRDVIYVQDSLCHINKIQTSPPTSRNAANNKISIDKTTIALPRKIILDRID